MASILRALKRKRLLPKPSNDDGMANIGEDANDRLRVRPCNHTSTSALGVVKLALSLGESAAEAVPLVGPPIKGTISAVLKILELLNVRCPFASACRSDPDLY